MNLDKILLLESMSLERAYEILGISSESELEDIIKIYRKQTKIKHPDAGGSHDDFIELQNAYDKALDYARRNETIKKSNPEYKNQKEQNYAQTISKDLFKLANKLRRKILSAKGSLELATGWQKLIAEALTADVFERGEDGELKIKQIINNLKRILEMVKSEQQGKNIMGLGNDKQKNSSEDKEKNLASDELDVIDEDLLELEDIVNQFDWFMGK